jgi:sulfite reductase (NADPH) hemoprotein beta-component
VTHEPNDKPDRTRDISQPLEKLHANELLKAKSSFLRGTIGEGLDDAITGSISSADQKLVKFHGMYMQDNRDLRDERRRQRLEPAYEFMVRVRLPGGVLDNEQWLALDAIAREYGCGSLRLTTRQTFQFHGILKGNLRATIQKLDAHLLDTIAACGDDCRGVMCSVNPGLSALHREVYELSRRASEHMRWKSRAYREIWLGDECVASGTGEPDEPFYGPTYLPRKFKIGFVTPPVNDIDVYAQDLGFIAIADGERLLGFDLCVGGGMGRTDRKPETYPRVADLIGFVTPDKVLAVAEHTAAIQRDHGDRTDRSRARFKYTLDTHGLPWFCAELEKRLGFALEPARPFEFSTNSDQVGWQRGSDGLWHLTLFVENGRVANVGSTQLFDALRSLARHHDVEFRLTPNQNLVISKVPACDRATVDALLERFGVDPASRQSPLRLHSMACVAFPTCGLAMAESERYLPSLLERMEELLGRHGLSEQAITVRMTGCPNGCARPYLAEIGLTGRAPGKYNLYLGGSPRGHRLNVLHAENVGEARILEVLDQLLGRFAREREPNEAFGDFVLRTGVVAAASAGDAEPSSLRGQKSASRAELQHEG